MWLKGSAGWPFLPFWQQEYRLSIFHPSAILCLSRWPWPLLHEQERGEGPVGRGSCGCWRQAWVPPQPSLPRNGVSTWGISLSRGEPKWELRNCTFCHLAVLVQNMRKILVLRGFLILRLLIMVCGFYGKHQDGQCNLSTSPAPHVYLRSVSHLQSFCYKRFYPSL